ncbi:MAG: globin domain-containing protein [Paracoccaceae bacterium]
MALNDRDASLIRESFDRLRAETATEDRFGPIFYAKLFEKLPEARPLFRDDLSEQGMRFLSTLHVIIDDIGEPDALAPKLRQLAEGHRAYGVAPGFYAPMGEALLETMRETLGSKFDPETEAAWGRAYALMTERMQAAA